MAAPLLIRDLRIYQPRLPLRLRFEHATASRDASEPVILRLTAAAPYAEHVGWGETLARVYVTGESNATVVRDLQEVLAPQLVAFRPTTFAEALAFIEALPGSDDGRAIHAARCALELALLDLAGQAFNRPAADAAGWLGIPGFGPPGALGAARYSGIAVGRTPRKLKTLLRLQRWYGLRDFKLKVAVDGWQARLDWTANVLGNAIRARRATLRVDANGGWSLSEALEALEQLADAGVTVLEQPLPPEQDDDLAYLAEQTDLDLMADESLLTHDDGVRLLGDGVRVLNIRLAKQGGLLPALQLAHLALQRDATVQLGCLVGETGILAAAGVAFLAACPRVRFVEGAFGRWLHKRDITRPAVRFGYRGRAPRLGATGLGIQVDEAAVQAHAPAPFVVPIG